MVLAIVMTYESGILEISSLLHDFVVNAKVLMMFLELFLPYRAIVAL